MSAIPVSDDELRAAYGINLRSTHELRHALERAHQELAELRRRAEPTALETRLHAALKAAWPYVDKIGVSNSAKNEVGRYAQLDDGLIAGQGVRMLFALQTAWPFIHGAEDSALMKEARLLLRNAPNKAEAEPPLDKSLRPGVASLVDLKKGDRFGVSSNASPAHVDLWCEVTSRRQDGTICAAVINGAWNLRLTAEGVPCEYEAPRPPTAAEQERIASGQGYPSLGLQWQPVPAHLADMKISYLGPMPKHLGYRDYNEAIAYMDEQLTAKALPATPAVVRHPRP